TPAGIRIVLRPHRVQQHFKRGDPHLQAQSAVAIVWIDPIVPGPQNQASRSQNTFVTRTTDLKECLILPFELDFPVVKAPRKVHRAINTEELLPTEALITAGIEYR